MIAGEVSSRSISIVQQPCEHWDGIWANSLIVPRRPATAASTASILIEEYANFLSEVRGLAAPTISHRRYTALCFLQHLDKEGIRLRKIQATQIESYITKAGKRLSRAALQNEISALRGFLRFLATDGRAPDGLASQIDTPRLYRLEKLPRSLPWETVRALLRSIDRTSAKGLRDYAMFLLMATYGLRSSEVVAITLDDLRWREGSLRIDQGKTSSHLELPLTNEVSCALVKHLKRTPPRPPYRRIFLRMHAPIGVLKPTALNGALLLLVRKNGLRIPFQGPHCLRHSLAVHLLQKGTPLKTIGDILGHRSAASTSTYLRLATDDLRSPTSRSGQGTASKRGTAMTRTTAAFSSLLAPVLARYVDLKRTLGLSFDYATRTLKSLDRFLHGQAKKYPDLNAAAFQAWCQTQEHVTSGERRKRMQGVYRFCLYRRRTEPRCFVPDAALFPKPHQKFQPYIFSEKEVANLLRAASGLKRVPSSPLRPEVIRLAMVLLFTTGIRLGELLRLTLGDYDRWNATLLIRESKFHKSRLLPLNDDIAEEIDRYLRAAAQRKLHLSRDTALIGNVARGGRAYSGWGLRSGLRPLLRKCSIFTPKGRLPRIHDFRHAHAVNALLRWYRKGAEVEAKLPLLATYMGHVSVVSTHYYLHWIEPLRTAASERFARHYGGLVVPAPS